MKRLAPILLAVSTLLGSVTALVKTIAEMRRDSLQVWDNMGYSVAEVERLKERIEALEKKEKAAP